MTNAQNAQALAQVAATLSPTDDTMAQAVRAWRRIGAEDRSALAGALGIVEQQDHDGHRPPLVAYKDGAKVVVATPWKPDARDFGDRERPDTFRGAMAVGGARWEAGNWAGPGGRMFGALQMLKRAGWAIQVVADATGAAAAVETAKRTLPTTLAIRRAKRGGDGADLTSLDGTGPTPAAAVDVDLSAL